MAMKLIVYLLLMLTIETAMAQNTKINVKLPSKSTTFGFRIEASNVDIEGYDGDDIIIEMIPKIIDKTPIEATGLKHIAIPAREKEIGENTLNPKIKENRELNGISITIPACNCERINIKVPKDPILSVVPDYVGREGKLSVKNINNEVQILGWMPIITLDNVAGFIMSTGGGYKGRKSSDKIVLSNIKWSEEPIMFNGRPRPRYYVVSSGTASIEISIPDTLKANIIYREGSGKTFSELNVLPTTPSKAMIEQFASHFNANPTIRSIVLNKGGFNIDLSSVDGNLYLRRQK